MSRSPHLVTLYGHHMYGHRRQRISELAVGFFYTPPLNFIFFPCVIYASF